MSKHKDLFFKISELEKSETPYVIATVFRVQGSSSGKVGDIAVYDPEGKRIIGYIGGGCIENRVAATAKESIQDGIPRTVEIDLDSDEMGMGIPCGGYMSVLVEPQIKVPTILIRGMGSVVENLCKLANLLKYKVIIQTSAQERERFPTANEIITEPLELENINFPVDYFVLATHHRDDDKLSFQALKKGIKYVAVVASEKKANIILNYLKENKITKEEMKNFHSPAGLSLKAKAPEEIALSIISEIVMINNGGDGKSMRIR